MRIPHLVNHPSHGTTGPMTCEFFRYASPLSEIYLEAASEINYLNPNNDYNGESQTGFSRAQGSIRDGLRCSTNKAYLRPIRHRDNLHVSLKSHVEKILINPKTKEAYGVLFTKESKKYAVFVSKEVILSAGAIQSPQILMLSGVGPKEHLKKFDIQVIHHSPGVGENLQDHIASGGGSYLITNPISNDSLSIIVPKMMQVDSIRNFAFNHRGPLYAMPACEIMAFINTKFQDPQEDWPDVQFFLASFADSADGGMFGKRASGISDDYYAEVYEQMLFKDAFMILPLVMRPKSRGRILLRDKNPHSHPLIYPNYFAHPRDLEIMVRLLKNDKICSSLILVFDFIQVEGSKFAYQLTQTKVFRAINATLNPNIVPACEKFPTLSDEFWGCLAKHYTQTIYHPVGTAKMGPPSDPMAVVDPQLRVYGVQNLRVIDASIMPTIVTGNTNIPTVMIAEKAADIIKTNYLGRPQRPASNSIPRQKSSYPNELNRR